MDNYTKLHKEMLRIVNIQIFMNWVNRIFTLFCAIVLISVIILALTDISVYKCAMIFPVLIAFKIGTKVYHKVMDNMNELYRQLRERELNYGDTVGSRGTND